MAMSPVIKETNINVSYRSAKSLVRQSGFKSRFGKALPVGTIVYQEACYQEPDGQTYDMTGVKGKSDVPMGAIIPPTDRNSTEVLALPDFKGLIG